MSFGDGQGASGGGPSNRQLGWLAAAALLVVVVAVVVILVTTSGSSHSADRQAAVPAPSTSTAQPTVTVTDTATTRAPTATITTNATTTPGGQLQPAGGPVPAGFQPQSFTAVSDDVWWVMGSASCSSPPCTSIVRSADGGRSWVGIPAPRTTGVSQLRFANAMDGYAAGPQLWSTRDGGETWSRVAVSATVADLAIAGGYVYAATGDGGLLRSAVGSDDFTQIASGDIPTVWAQGGQVLADEQSGAGVSSLLASANAGKDFATQAAPSATVQCSFVTTGDGVIWAPCATGTEGSVWRSGDGGTQWSPRAPGTGAGSGQGESNGAPFAAASGTVAVYGGSTVYRTTDGGVVWSPVTGLDDGGDVAYLGFTDPEHGVAIVDTDSSAESTAALYATSDGGASYGAVTITAG